jgi:7-cyano-7-deazaguanine reductase
MEIAKPAITIADTRTAIDTEAKFALLETFPLQNQHPQLIHIQTHEFSAVCPGTGLPDIGLLDIEYIPSARCLELKSLKYYVVAWRDEGIFQEPVTDLIFDHLWRALLPQFLRIQMQYNIRGGFLTTTVAERGERNIRL